MESIYTSISLSQYFYFGLNQYIYLSVYEKLFATGAFETMSVNTDENEHSIEMHLPYVAKVMER